MGQSKAKDGNATNKATEEVEQAAAYEQPQVKSLSQGEVLSAVNKGSKFPARGFSG
jgi:hypothetical protein